MFIDRTDKGGTRPSLFHLSKRSEKVKGVTPRLFTTCRKYSKLTYISIRDTNQGIGDFYFVKNRELIKKFDAMMKVTDKQSQVTATV